jgi:hypothetical protein
MSESLNEVYQQLRPLLQKYSTKLVAKKDSEKGIELWTNKEITWSGRQFRELFFASAAIQKNFVGFYYFPIYMHPETKKDISPRLLKLLKGKSCFHVKKLDDELLKDIESSLKKGYEFYKKQGFV